jgi:hypothetical protein
MTSTLQVQTLQGPTSGVDSNVIRIADGHNLHAKGHVVQFVSDINTSATSISTTSTTPVFSGIGVTITPKFIGSRIVVSFDTPVTSLTEVADFGIRATLYDLLFNKLTEAFWINQTAQAGVLRVYQGLSLNYEAVTTSLTPLTFNIYFNTFGSGGTAGNTGFLRWVNTSIALTATEIAQ